MPFLPLALPKTLPDPVQATIESCLEPLLRDVHWMLGTVVAEPRADGPPRQLQLPVALTLFAAVAGLSSKKLFQPKHGDRSGDRFRECLTRYFPWDACPADGTSPAKASGLLYRAFRNPLVHCLGFGELRDPAIRIGQAFRGSSDAENRVEDLERATDPGPCLIVARDSYLLRLDPFYWGVRKLVERWSQDEVQVTHAASCLARPLPFRPEPRCR